MIGLDVLAKGGESVKAGPIGLVTILLLCIACYFLFKSMSKHLKNVREEFPLDGAAPPGTQVRAEQRAMDPTAYDAEAFDGAALDLSEMSVVLDDEQADAEQPRPRSE